MNHMEGPAERKDRFHRRSGTAESAHLKASYWKIPRFYLYNYEKIAKKSFA